MLSLADAVKFFCFKYKPYQNSTLVTDHYYDSIEEMLTLLIDEDKIM